MMVVFTFWLAPAMATGPPAGSATFAYSYNATNQRIGQSTTDTALLGQLCPLDTRR